MNTAAEKNLSFLLAQKPSRVMKMAEILETIPHREPFLFIDSVEIIEENKFGVGSKFFSPGEPFFRGHFPGKPVLPGAIILEAMAQTGAAMIMSLAQYRGKIAFFVAMDGVKFRRQVFPGQTLKLAVSFLRCGGRAGKTYCEAYAGGALCAEAELTFSLG
ncbi:MAG: 3-hydroxyacyl-ACP dehydratase FabZ [Elusimicrobia bacterium]|nr:3-hydroxyacyl-ACP dehydratase FabZ [Elusimicrobiota bacterium]